MNHTLSLALKSTYLLGFAVLGFNLHKCIMDSWLQLLTHYLFIRFIPISLPIFQQFIFYFQVLAGILANRAQSLPPPSVILKDRRRLQKREEEEEVKGRKEGLPSLRRSIASICYMCPRRPRDDRERGRLLPPSRRRPCPCYSLKGADTLPLRRPCRNGYGRRGRLFRLPS